MDLDAARRNIGGRLRFQASVRGGLLWRLTYVLLYYGIFLFFRRGDRHLRPQVWLKRLGLAGKEVEVEARGGLRWRLDLHTAFDPLFCILEERDYWELPDFEPKPGWTVLDVGANVGVFTALAASKVGPGGTVAAVEPHPGNATLLRANIVRSGLANVRVVEAAAADKAGAGKLFLQDFAINHSLVRESGRSVAIAVDTLDAVAARLGLGKVDLIKVDTEGGAVAALRGAKGLIERDRPRIVLERDPEDSAAGLDALLAGWGYEAKPVRTLLYFSPK